MFSLLGTTYGGGRTTFKLPDLPKPRGGDDGKDRVQVDSVSGKDSGEEKLTLTSMQLAAHDHIVMAASATDVTKNTQFPGNAVRLGPTVGDDEGAMAMNAYVVEQTGGRAAYSPSAPDMPPIDTRTACRCWH